MCVMLAAQTAAGKRNFCTSSPLAPAHTRQYDRYIVTTATHQTTVVSDMRTAGEPLYTIAIAIPLPAATNMDEEGPLVCRGELLARPGGTGPKLHSARSRWPHVVGDALAMHRRLAAVACRSLNMQASRSSSSQMQWGIWEF